VLWYQHVLRDVDKQLGFLEDFNDVLGLAIVQRLHTLDQTTLFPRLRVCFHLSSKGGQLFLQNDNGTLNFLFLHAFHKSDPGQL
jgi:hypothetical protein